IGAQEDVTLDAVYAEGRRDLAQRLGHRRRPPPRLDRRMSAAPSATLITPTTSSGVLRGSRPTARTSTPRPTRTQKIPMNRGESNGRQVSCECAKSLGSIEVGAAERQRAGAAGRLLQQRLEYPELAVRKRPRCHAHVQAPEA